MYQISKNKSILGHFQNSFFVFFTIMALFLFNFVSASEIFNEDFDSPIWALHESIGGGKNGWQLSVVSGNHVWISNLFYVSSPYSGEVSNSAAAGSMWNINTSQGVDYVDFYFKSSILDSPNESFNFLIYGKKTTHDEIVVFLGTQPDKLKYTINGINYFDVGDIYSGWNYLKIEVDKAEDKWRVKFNALDFTDWKETYTSGLDFDYIDKVQFLNGNNTLWIDNFILGESGCDISHLFKCSTLGSCISAGGIWNVFSQSCLDISQTYACATGINLQYCDNETSCSNYGGYWQNNFCWEYQGTGLIPFSTYYEQNSSFSEPTIAVSNLASFSYPLMENINNFLAIFSSNFSVASASAGGTQLGSAISQANGYLDTINEFFGGLPVSQGLLVYLIVLLGVAVFRIANKLFHLAKP